MYVFLFNNGDEEWSSCVEGDTLEDAMARIAAELNEFDDMGVCTALQFLLGSAVRAVRCHPHMFVDVRTPVPFVDHALFKTLRAVLGRSRHAWACDELDAAAAARKKGAGV